MPLADQLDRDLEQVLRSRAVNVVEPRDQMVQLNAVEAGAGFSKPATNVLLHRQLDLSWRVFVDDDFRYLGGDRLRCRLFSGPQQDRWRELTPPEPLLGDLNNAILRVLGWLESPVQSIVPLPLRTGDAPAATAETSDPELERNGRFLDTTSCAPWQSSPCRPKQKRSSASPAWRCAARRRPVRWFVGRRDAGRA